MVDLSKIKEEISERKKNKNIENEKRGIVPHNRFLYELKESLERGQKSALSERIKMVENKVSQKDGGKTLHVDENLANKTIQQNAVSQQQVNNPRPNIPNNDVDREQKLYDEMEKRKKEYEQYMLGISSQQQNNQNIEYPQKTNNSINESEIVGLVKKEMNENFAIVVENAMKNTIIDVYTKARMKETIEENYDVIKKIVFQVIRELKKEKK